MKGRSSLARRLSYCLKSVGCGEHSEPHLSGQFRRDAVHCIHSILRNQWNFRKIKRSAVRLRLQKKFA
jgi:hypothetical protein